MLTLIVSSHQWQNNFFGLGEGPTYGIDGIFGPSEKKCLVLSLVKQRQNFA